MKDDSNTFKPTARQRSFWEYPPGTRFQLGRGLNRQSLARTMQALSLLQKARVGLRGGGKTNMLMEEVLWTLDPEMFRLYKEAQHQLEMEEEASTPTSPSSLETTATESPATPSTGPRTT